MRKAWFAEGLLLFTVFIWGVNTPFMKMGLLQMPPFIYNALRLILAAVIAWPVLFYSRSYRSVDKCDVKMIVAVSIFGFVFPQILLTIGLPQTTAGNASLMSTLMPLSVALINRIFKNERISTAVGMGMMLSLIGAVLVVLGSGKNLSLEGPHIIGTLLVLLSQIGGGYYTVYSKDLLEKYSAYQIITYIMTLSAISFTIMAFPDILVYKWSETPREAWASIIFCGLFGLFLGNFFWVWVLGKVGSTKAALYQYLTPVFTIITARIFLGETFGLLQFAGSVVIFAGVYLTRLKLERSFFTQIQNTFSGRKKTC